MRMTSLIHLSLALFVGVQPRPILRERAVWRRRDGRKKKSQEYEKFHYFGNKDMKMKNIQHHQKVFVPKATKRRETKKKYVQQRDQQD